MLGCAVGGINAGGFQDEKGFGNGGTPIGIVISGGKLIFGAASSVTTVIGFDGDGKLIVGRMSAAAALQKVTESTHPGAIFLLHAVSPTNAEILGQAIDSIRSQGYTFTTAL